MLVRYMLHIIIKLQLHVLALGERVVSPKTLCIAIHLPYSPPQNFINNNLICPSLLSEVLGYCAKLSSISFYHD